MSKIVLVAVGAVGYVLGARAGRERYEQISDLAQRWWNDPRVQRKKSEASEAIKDKASTDAPTNGNPSGAASSG